jgi:hypothetical protein
MTSDIRSLPGGLIKPSGYRRPPNDQRTTATTAARDLHAFDLVELALRFLNIISK